MDNDNNNGASERSNQAEIGFITLFLASSILLVFTFVAAVVIVAWGPLIPEAAAVNLDRKKTPFSDYVILHESWHSIAASRHALSCEQ